MEVGFERHLKLFPVCSFCFLLGQDASSQLVLPPPCLLPAATPAVVTDSFPSGTVGQIHLPSVNCFDHGVYHSNRNVLR